MRILLTNDDGIHAEGLEALERIAAALGDEVWVCAPEYEQSGASRALTLAEPLRVRKLGPRKFAVDGTPTDCVMLAVSELMDGRPDLVLSGVNRGQNLGEDVGVSGTVAGAIQGMTLGIPSVALSQSLPTFHIDERAPYELAEEHAPSIIRRALAAGWPRDVVLNLNFPHRHGGAAPVIEATRQGFRSEVALHFERRQDLRGRDYYWTGFAAHSGEPEAGTDIRAIAEGRISITPLHIDLTHERALNDLKALFP